VEKVGELKEITALGNVKLGSDSILCTVNPKLYPLDIVYSAAYVLIDKAYILLDGDPATEIKVEIRKKKDSDDLKSLAIEFNEQLLNYSVYKVQSERNRGIRELMLQKVLFTNAPAVFMQQMKQAEMMRRKNEANTGSQQEILPPQRH
jgi:His-Xaa-Ser system protein HxsD